MKELAFEIRNLNTFFFDKHILKNVNMEILKNKITAIIGPSGCGKTTLIRCLNRMNDLYPYFKLEGEILFNGVNIYSNSLDVTELRRKIGMVFQKPNPFPKSIYENVAFGLRIRGIRNKRKLDELVENALKRAALWDEVKNELHKNAYMLSGGQQQRLCIARIIAVEPDVLLLDEPSAAIDPISTMKIEKLLEELKQNYTIIIVTHNIYQAARIADYTAFMMLGEIIEFNETGKMFTSPKDKRTEAYLMGRFG